MAILLWPLAKSWRFRYFVYQGGNLLEVGKKQLPAARCLAILHGHQLPLVAFSPYKHLAALASRSKDGQIAATLLKYWHILPLRGSSHHGGSEALDLAREHILSGGEVVMTVDGPRGPRGCCKRGIVEVAVAGGVGVQTIVARPQSCWRLHSWDGFIIPRPFSRVGVIYGSEINVPPDLAGAQIFAKCDEISSELKLLEDLALWK